MAPKEIKMETPNVEVNEASSLEDLFDRIKSIHNYDRRHETHLAEQIDMTDLPIFGGVTPEFTSAVWSWDEESLLIGEEIDDLEIVNRYTISSCKEEIEISGGIREAIQAAVEMDDNGQAAGGVAVCEDGDVIVTIDFPGAYTSSAAVLQGQRSEMPPEVVELMNAELREKVRSEGGNDSAAEFLGRYCELHAEKFGEYFKW